jgi:hypothetical protein
MKKERRSKEKGYSFVARIGAYKLLGLLLFFNGRFWACP